jgi:preprotein translocase SecE subunit
MSLLVQQQSLAKAYFSVGIISLFGVYAYHVTVASVSVNLLAVLAFLTGVALLALKSLATKDFAAAALITASVVVLGLSDSITWIPQNMSVALFVLFMTPVIFMARVDEKMTELLAVISELRREIRRVTWPTVQETLQFVAIVATFVVVAAVFWAFIDRIIQWFFSILFYYLA